MPGEYALATVACEFVGLCCADCCCVLAIVCSHLALANRYLYGSSAVSGFPDPPPAFSLLPSGKQPTHPLDYPPPAVDACGETVPLRDQPASSEGLGVTECGPEDEFLPRPLAVRRNCATAAAELAVIAQQADAQHYKINSTVAHAAEALLRDGKFHGEKGESDEVAAYQLDRAEAGDPSAQMWLGGRYYRGQGGLPRDPVRAAHWFQQVRWRDWLRALHRRGGSTV